MILAIAAGICAVLVAVGMVLGSIDVVGGGAIVVALTGGGTLLGLAAYATGRPR